MRVHSRTVHSEAGLSLIEVLIALVVLGIGVVGIVAMLANSLSAASSIKQRADVAQVVTRVADAIQRAAWECDTAVPTNSYATSTLNALKPDASWTISVTSMTHWGPSRTFETGCPATGSDPIFKMLDMNVVVQGPSAVGLRTIELMKRP